MEKSFNKFIADKFIADDFIADDFTTKKITTAGKITFTIDVKQNKSGERKKNTVIEKRDSTVSNKMNVVNHGTINVLINRSKVKDDDDDELVDFQRCDIFENDDVNELVHQSLS